jgi:hypothetical protein
VPAFTGEDTAKQEVFIGNPPEVDPVVEVAVYTVPSGPVRVMLGAVADAQAAVPPIAVATRLRLPPHGTEQDDPAVALQLLSAHATLTPNAVRQIVSRRHCPPGKPPSVSGVVQVVFDLFCDVWNATMLLVKQHCPKSHGIWMGLPLLSFGWPVMVRVVPFPPMKLLPLFSRKMVAPLSRLLHVALVLVPRMSVMHVRLALLLFVTWNENVGVNDPVVQSQGAFVT